MKFHSKLLLGASSLAMIASAGTASVFAADEELTVEEVVVVGSRRAARSAGDTPAPVDVISGSTLDNQAGGDMSDLLRNVVPSYNVNTQPINDAATLIRPANLRGLAPDQTLVLVNGKRRHRAAVITFLGSGISDGSQGADISAIPSLAMKQVEVLRDGAAAQYGSDAIAGVINFALKDASEGGSIVAKYGSTFEGDGETKQISANVGLPLGDTGFINITGEWREAGATSRSEQRDDAASLALGVAPFRDPAMIWGAPEVSDDIKVFVNMGAEISEGMEFYAFGNYSERTVLGGFYYRNPDNRGGVFASGDTRLVGDLDGVDMGGSCPTGVDPNDQAAYDAIFADPNCFIFNEMFPGGFTPNFGGTLKDHSLTAGVRGEAGGWNFDMSGSYGKNQIDFRIINTVNASLGPNTPTEFSPGTYIQTEQGINLDMSKGFDVGLASDLNVAFGAEWREEEFELIAGDAASWARGPLFDQGFSSGSNGFNGFSDAMAGVWDRTSKAVYADFEADVTEDFVLGAAVRWEDFSSFGTTVNGKLSALYHVSEEFKVRGTASTGFRAPSPGQANVSNVSTLIVFDAVTGEPGLVDQGTIPSASPLAVAIAAANNTTAGVLGEEKSTSFSMGVAYETDAASLTVDFFNIKVKDRISMSDTISITAEEALALENSGITGAANFRAVSWFQNAFDTRTTGIDVVFNMPLELTDEGQTNLTLSGNYTKTKVTAGTIGDSDRAFLLENALPNLRGNMTLTHTEDSWRALARVNYHGAYSELFAGGDLQNPGSEFTLDLEAAYSVTENFEVVVGAENVFNNFPDRVTEGTNSWSGAFYPESAPFGINGGVYYAKIKYTF